MPVLRGAVTFSRFRVEPSPEAGSDSKRWLPKGLRAHAFEPIDRKGEEERASGFVELERTDGVEFAPSALYNGEWALFGFRVDTLKVSASAIKAELETWEKAFEEREGRLPGRAEKAAQRTQVRHMLRQRAVPSTRVSDVSWNLKTGQLQVWAASRRTVEEVAVALESALPVKLTALVPAALAAEAGVAEDALKPTPELSGAGSTEVEHE